jgi:peptide/nickel transport system ATP-binding protein
MAPLLTISGLTIEGRRAGDRWQHILEDASISVDPGEVVALIGESGAGKTTLALAALGYCRPGTRIVAGRALLGETDLVSLARPEKRVFRGRDVAYVAQSAAAALNPGMTIGAQIGEGLLLHRLANRSEVRKRVTDLLQLLRLPEPSAIAARYPLQTSGGQQQRAMTAMAMSCAPKLLVLDEPTTALDVTTQIEVLRAIKDAIRCERAAAIYVSHDIAVVAQIATRIIVMRHGRIVEEGGTEQILYSPRHDYTRALLAAVRAIPASIEPHSTPARGRTPVLTARAIEATYRRRWLGRTSPDQHVLRDASIELQPGETLALVGESGSGKSTLARVIAGLHQPLAGRVELDGRVLKASCRGRRTEELRRIQIVFQSPEQVLNPKVRVGRALGRVASLYFGLSGRELDARVHELLRMVGLPEEFAQKFPGELSGGQRQRVAIARAFAARPDVVLCDEFLSALDTLVAARILDLMAELKLRHRVAYVFISHDLGTVATIADRVAVMYAGRVVESGPTEAVFRAPHHPYTNLLVRSVPELRADWLEEATASGGGKQGRERDSRSPIDSFCAFRSRCPHFIPGTCDSIAAPARELGKDHVIHCHLEADALRLQHVPRRSVNPQSPSQPKLTLAAL